MNPKEKTRNHLFRLLSFLLPCGILMLVFALSGLAPFGEKTPLHGDAGAQYYPFLLLFRRALRNGESLLFTWRSGLGTSFVPLIAYFCFNFVNLIACFLPEAWIANYLAISIIVRIGLAGLFFTIMVQTIRPKLDIAAPVFGTLFALNGWILASFWQTVWLDVFAMTPLLIAGLIRMVRDHDHRLYPLILGLSLAFNFYLAFISCCIAGLAWIGILIVKKTKLKEFPRELGRFLGFSVLGAALAAVLLIPTALYLRNLDMYHETFPALTQTYSSLPALLGQLVSFTFPIINNDPANVSAGMLAIFLAAGFLLAPFISGRERVFAGFLLVFLLLSCWWAPLNFIWHGFHYPHVTVQRFAYLIPLVMAWMGWRYTTSLPQEKPAPPPQELPWYRRPLFQRILQFSVMLLFTGGILLCAVRKESTDIFLVCAVFAALYCGLYLFRMLMPGKRFVFSLLLVVFVSAELCFSLQNGMTYVGGNNSSLMQPNPEVSAAVSDIQKDAQDEENIAYRTAMSADALNYELLYDIPAATSSFTSMLPPELKNFCRLLGLNAQEKGYYIKYRPSFPLAHLLLNQQYFISREEIPGTEPLSGENDVALRNLYRTYMGFCISENASLSEVTGSRSADTQNRILQRLTGTDLEMFTPVLPEKTETNDAKAEQKTDFQIHYQAEDNPEEGEPVKPRLELEYTVPEDGDFMLSFRFSEGLPRYLKKYEILLHGEEILSETFVLDNYVDDSFYKSLFDLKKGQKLSVKLYFIFSAEGDIEISLDQYHKEIFDEAYQIMTESPFEVTAMEGPLLEGKVTAEKDSLLYLSVPYDSGWTAYVDGNEVPTERVLDAMTGLTVPAGTHQVTLRYHVKGLVAGIVISIGAWLFYLILFLRETKRRKKAGKQGAEDACAP